VAGRLNQRKARLHSTLNDRSDLDTLSAQHDLSGPDACYVEQVIYQTHHVTDLALHDVACLVDGLARNVRHAQDMQAVS
jgi:hypothetical protein